MTNEQLIIDYLDTPLNRLGKNTSARYKGLHIYDDIIYSYNQPIGFRFASNMFKKKSKDVLVADIPQTSTTTKRHLSKLIEIAENKGFTVHMAHFPAMETLIRQEKEVRNV